MSAQHTQGRLHVGEMHEGALEIKHDRYLIAEVISAFNHAVDEANARRLVACWNACEGIPTEEMESKGLPLYMHRKLIAQCGQLLAAADAAQKFIRDTPIKVEPYGNGYKLAENPAPVMRILSMLDAAIAACQPQPTVAHLPADDTEGGAA